MLGQAWLIVSSMQEAGNLLAKKLPIPGYQHLLKLSHCFNVLDARGAIGVTQRAKCFATMRKLAKQVIGQSMHQMPALKRKIETEI